MDELWSFVGSRHQKVWLWAILCQRTRQIIAFVCGDRCEATCRRLWQSLPDPYRACQSFKASGQTNHIERLNNTIRQRIGRLTRKSLSFSKRLLWHERVIYWFVVSYNLSFI